MKKKNMIKTALVCALLAGCSGRQAASSTGEDNKDATYARTSTEQIFDTVYAYQEYGASNSTAKKHFEDSEKLLKQYNDLYDIYNSYDGLNNLKTVNDNAGKKPVKVDQKIIDMLKMAKDFYGYSDGEFDITMGSLLNVWHTYREEGIKLNEKGELGKLPSDDELKKAAVHKGWDKVQIDEKAKTVYITDPDVSLDVGGIAKGYAAEMTAKAMEKDGMKSGVINVGRNIRLVGMKSDGSDWNVGIADPSGSMPNGILAIKEDHPLSVVTSGDYERYYKAEDGNIYPHIIDPQTMYPAKDYHSVTILTEDSGAADCLSTTLFTMSVEEGKQVLKKYTEDTGKDAQAVWIMDPDKSQNEEGKKVESYFITYTDGLKDLITWQSE